MEPFGSDGDQGSEESRSGATWTGAEEGDAEVEVRAFAAADGYRLTRALRLPATAPSPCRDGGRPERAFGGIIAPFARRQELTATLHRE